MLQSSHMNVIPVCENTRECQPRPQAKQQQYVKNISRVIPVIWVKTEDENSILSTLLPFRLHWVLTNRAGNYSYKYSSIYFYFSHEQKFLKEKKDTLILLLSCLHHLVRQVF